MRISLLLSAFLFVSLSAFAQTSPSTGQWLILATSETNSNTLDGTPLQFITDWTTTTHGNGNSATISPVLANTFTNSACSASGQPANFSASYNPGHNATTITVTVDNAQTLTFTQSAGNGSTNFTGTFKSSGGGCTQADSGSFSATLYQPVDSPIVGTIESYAGTNPVTATITSSVDSNFNVTGTVSAPTKPCFASLTINGTAAQAYGASIATGDVEVLFASDDSGDVAAFVLSATDANGKTLTPPWPASAFVTYVALAGPCSGDSGTDAPFHAISHHYPRHMPLRPRRFQRGGRDSDATPSVVPNAEIAPSGVIAPSTEPVPGSEN